MRYTLTVDSDHSRTPDHTVYLSQRCPKAHLYEGDNLHLGPKGNKVCKACRHGASTAYKQGRSGDDAFKLEKADEYYAKHGPDDPGWRAGLATPKPKASTSRRRHTGSPQARRRPKDTRSWLESELWLPVVDYEKYYQVSNFGRVWSNGRWVPGRWGPESLWKPGSILTPAPTPAGRLKVTLSADGRRRESPVHIMVARAFHGPCPEGYHCCHNDGDHTNNTADNLRWGTVSSNIIDEVKHGTHRNSSKTHCPMEHPLAEPNLIEGRTPKGTATYRCKSCFNARATIRYRTGSGKGAADHPDFKVLADEQCDRWMPGWRDWTPPEGFSRSA